MDINEFTHYVDKIVDKLKSLNENFTECDYAELIDKQMNLLSFLKDKTIFDIQDAIDKNIILPDYMYCYFLDNFSIQDEYYDSDFYTMNRLLILDMENKLPDIEVNITNEHLLIKLYVHMLEYCIDSLQIDTDAKKTYFENIETYCIRKQLWEKYLEQIQQLKTTLAQNLAIKYLNLIKTEFNYYSIEDFEDWANEVFALDSDNKTVLELKNTVEKIKLDEQECDLENSFLPDSSIAVRPICEIANDILEQWSNISITAEPYLNAMLSLETLDDFYGQDSAYNIVSYFLSNANGNLSPEEKTLKYELMNLLKLYEIKKENN